MGTCVNREMGLGDQQWSKSRQKLLQQQFQQYKEKQEQMKQMLEERRQANIQAKLNRNREIEKEIRRIQNDNIDGSDDDEDQQQQQQQQKMQEEESQEIQDEEKNSIISDDEADKMKILLKKDDPIPIPKKNNLISLNQFFQVPNSNIKHINTTFTEISQSPIKFGNPIFKAPSEQHKQSNISFQNVFSDDEN